jgi:ribosome-associated toxin RatA of RatAB toxin-antitoxin module
MMKISSVALVLGYLTCFSLLANPLKNPARAEQITANQPLIIAQKANHQKNATKVTGANGQYVAQMRINASPAEVWRVLTDYNNFNQFIPNVISSRLISADGNVKIIEQISERVLFGVPIQTRMRTQNRETYQQQINFNLISGDLSKLQGYWKIEPVGSGSGSANQVLLTYQVEAQPPSGVPAAFFYDVFKNSLEPTLNAIRQAAEN